MTDTTAPVLMTPANPRGWKLEELLAVLQAEIGAKSLKITRDPGLVARRVLRNNQQIVGLLAQAEALQRGNLDDLAGIAPDPGPDGPPRIGAASCIGAIAREPV